MRGIVSFHPIDVEFFDRLIAPLTAGEKVNPEQFLDTARRARTAEWHVKGHKRALETLLTLLEPPPPPAEGTLWDKVRTRLERFDFKPDPTAALVAGRIEPDLHLCGRPFFICEGSAAGCDEGQDAGTREAKTPWHGTWVGRRWGSQ